MKNTLLITSTIISLLGLIGCSNFEDTTSVGSQLIQEADPSFLDFGKNYTTLSLDTSIVTDSKSIPQNSSDLNFGVHTSTILPVGGKDGEISTAYYQFKPSFDNWLKCRSIDTLIDSASVFSAELIFSKADSLDSVCNYDQTVNLFYVEDSSYKYHRNQVITEQLLNSQSDKVLFKHKLDPAKLKIPFNDTATLSKKLRETFSSNRSEYDTMKNEGRKKFKDTLKLPTFNFVVASNDFDKKYALMSGSAALKVHFYKGEYKSSTTTTLKDTSDFDTLKSPPTPIDSLLKRTRTFASMRDTSKVSNDTLYNIEEGTLISSFDTTIYRHGKNLIFRDTNIVKNDKVVSRKRVKYNDSTLIIDTTVYLKVTSQINELIDTAISVSTYNVVYIDSIINSQILSEDSTQYTCKSLHFKIDTIKQTLNITYDTLIRMDTTITLDTIIMKADSLSVPLSYSNYVMYETKETFGSRTNLTPYPISSFGPQRTAVFELKIDSLRNTLAQQPTGTHPAFNKILSAGVSITGTLAPSFRSSTMSDTTDTTISVRWFVSESEDLMKDGLLLHKTDKAIGRIDTLESGNEAVLPIEKNLQEILSRKPELPSTVYLYLEPISSKNFNKQVIWSKPSLITVLTTSTKK